MLQEWVAALAGMDASSFVRSPAGDSRIAVRYRRSLQLTARWWAVEDAEGTLSTARLSSGLGAPDTAALDRCVRRLLAVLCSGAVVSAAFRPESHILDIRHPRGTLRMLPNAEGAEGERDLLAARASGWTVERNGHRIWPDGGAHPCVPPGKSMTARVQ